MYKIYQVEYGDTLDIIAEKTNTTRENIKNINGINNDSELVVGGLIVVPNTNNMMFETYRVRQGDSIYSISRMYNVNPDVLLALNGLNKNDYIYPNQEILIPMSNMSVYITKQGDTVKTLIDNLGIDANDLNRQNNKILVVEDQLIVSKKESN